MIQAKSEELDKLILRHYKGECVNEQIEKVRQELHELLNKKKALIQSAKINIR